MNRELNGCYFRVERGGRYQNICFSEKRRVQLTSVGNEKTDAGKHPPISHILEKVKTNCLRFQYFCGKIKVWKPKHGCRNINNLLLIV